MNMRTIPRHDWSAKGENNLSQGAICRLFRGIIPFIRLPNFANLYECEQLVTGAVDEGFSSYRGVEPVINRLGNTVFEYNSLSKGDYFAKNRELTVVQERIFKESFNPLERFMDLLRLHTGKDVSVPTNADDDPYYAGLRYT